MLMMACSQLTSQTPLNVKTTCNPEDYPLPSSGQYFSG